MQVVVVPGPSSGDGGQVSGSEGTPGAGWGPRAAARPRCALPVPQLVWEVGTVLNDGALIHHPSAAVVLQLKYFDILGERILCVCVCVAGLVVGVREWSKAVQCFAGYLAASLAVPTRYP